MSNAKTRENQKKGLHENFRKLSHNTKTHTDEH